METLESNDRPIQAGLRVWLDTCCKAPELWDLWIKIRANAGRIFACKAALVSMFVLMFSCCSTRMNPACVLVLKFQ